MRSVALALLAVGCGFQRLDPPPAPRLIAPLSTATVSVARPTLRFSLPPGAGAATVELCRRRDCQGALGHATVDDSGTRAVPDDDLPAGVSYWRVRASTAKGTGVSAVWQLRVAAASAPVESVWGSALDIDGDGRAELAVGVPTADGAEPADAAGRVYLYAGGPDGPDPQRVTLLTPPAVGGQFGAALATVDFDGDGYADLAVGAPSLGVAGSGVSGAVYVFRGGPAGLSATPGFTLAVSDAGDFGASLDGAGDVNGDGYGDLVVGAPLTLVDGVLVGAAYVFFGGPEGGNQISPLNTGDGKLAKVGWAVAGGGDLDGDGYDDVVVGVPDSPSSDAGHGRVFVFRGQAMGLAPSPIILDESVPERARFGWAVALVGDRDGDGRVNLAVGSPGQGRVYLYGGGVRGLGAPLVVDGPDGSGTSFGDTLAGGDVDGDGVNEVMVGAVCAPLPGATCPGRVYQLAGAAVGQTWTGPSALAAFGTALVLADHDGDGRADLAVGASGVDADLGLVDWFRGGAPVAASPGRILHGVDPGGFFGIALR